MKELYWEEIWKVRFGTQRKYLHKLNLHSYASTGPYYLGFTCFFYSLMFKVLLQIICSINIKFSYKFSIASPSLLRFFFKY